MITNDEHHSSKDASALSKDANCLAAPGPAPSDHRRFSPPLLRVEAPVARPCASRSSARPDARLGRPRWRRARPANADGPRGCPSGLAVGARRPARGGRTGRLNRRCGGAPPPKSSARGRARPDRSAVGTLQIPRGIAVARDRPETPKNAPPRRVVGPLVSARVRGRVQSGPGSRSKREPGPLTASRPTGTRPGPDGPAASPRRPARVFVMRGASAIPCAAAPPDHRSVRRDRLRRRYSRLRSTAWTLSPPPPSCRRRPPPRRPPDPISRDRAVRARARMPEETQMPDTAPQPPRRG